MMTIPISEIEKAFEFDASLKLSKTITMSNRLKKTYLPAERYSLKKLYDSMYEGRSVVFKDYPLRLVVPASLPKNEFIAGLLKSNLPANEKIAIRTGPKRTLKKVTIADALNRWERGRSRFGVTDLHFRNTKFYNKVDAKAISYFNLLPACPEEVSFLEMLTLVVSSKGIFSDSHSDDGDGSNHCFVGKKLWFAWDREEGRKAGLQDCTYDPVFDKARFSLQKFLSLKSAHWFLVEENQTLFMPGNFSHKVVTMEPYIGFGSFYVSYPNYLRTVKRWTLLETSDVKNDFIAVMHKTCIKNMAGLKNAPAARKNSLGFNYLQKAVKDWKNGLSAQQVKKLQENMVYESILQTVGKLK